MMRKTCFMRYYDGNKLTYYRSAFRLDNHC